jgi:hypothetical protein
LLFLIFPKLDPSKKALVGFQSEVKNNQGKKNAIDPQDRRRRMRLVRKGWSKG